MRQPEWLEVPVAGGSLSVARWVAQGPGQGSADDRPVVLAAHGITANALCFTDLAGALDDMTLVAPDLRGRAGSGTLPAPYGMLAHVDDLLRVLDALAPGRPVIAVGHSMGGFVMANLAARHPEAVERVVLVDGGYALPAPEGVDVDEVLHAVIGPAMARLSMEFASRDDYHDFWRRHPAVGPAWSPGLVAYLDRDLVGEPPRLRSSCAIEAIRADASDTFAVADTRDAVLRLGVPASFLRAERGMLDETPGLYDDARTAAFQAAAPDIRVATVPGVNHYSVLFAPHAVAALAAEARGEGSALAG